MEKTAFVACSTNFFHVVKDNISNCSKTELMVLMEVTDSIGRMIETERRARKVSEEAERELDMMLAGKKSRSV